MATPRTTRSLTRSMKKGGASPTEATLKRKLESPPVSQRATTSKKKKAEAASVDTSRDLQADPPAKSADVPSAMLSPVVNAGQTLEILPPTLPFSLDDAKRHLGTVDIRFRKLFEQVPCKPFEIVETVEPFRTLATSILGQQISWKAARSIKHKFICLYDASLPESPPGVGQQQIDFFPTPQQVTATPIPTLRTAGLSARKAEYIMDLASRFADDRLSATKIATASDQEIYDMLIAVKGIGPWTVEMFQIFSLRRPDILPCGDLGVQKGLLRWVLASHSSEAAKKINIAPFRLPGADEESRDDDAANASPQKEAPVPEGEEVATSVLPAPNNPSVPPVTPRKKKPTAGKSRQPSALHTLSALAGDEEMALEPIPLPDGLSISAVKSRLAGKKAKKGVYLTPDEMQALTASWAPYRSLAVWYMWSIVDDGTVS